MSKNLTLPVKLAQSIDWDEIPAPSDSDPTNYKMLQTSTQVFYLYPNRAEDELEVFYKDSKLGKNKMLQHIKGKIVSLISGFYSGLAQTRLII